MLACGCCGCCRFSLSWATFLPAFRFLLTEEAASWGGRGVYWRGACVYEIWCCRCTVPLPWLHVCCPRHDMFEEQEVVLRFAFCHIYELRFGRVLQATPHAICHLWLLLLLLLLLFFFFFFSFLIMCNLFADLASQMMSLAQRANVAHSAKVKRHALRNEDIKCQLALATCCTANCSPRGQHADLIANGAACKIVFYFFIFGFNNKCPQGWSTFNAKMMHVAAAAAAVGGWCCCRCCLAQLLCTCNWQCDQVDCMIYAAHHFRVHGGSINKLSPSALNGPTSATAMKLSCNWTGAQDTARIYV